MVPERNFAVTLEHPLSLGLWHYEPAHNKESL